ncbi:MAG: hypothetical protein LBF22_11480 [Deltaproteobacteria bacterium]|nr:hypothetical protein [Deltaproteobacteria bacterium]
MYLGKVVNQEKGLFFRPGIGNFSFTIENGFYLIDSNNEPSLPNSPVSSPASVSLHFGDVWMLDQIFKKTGLDKVIENLFPKFADTLKSLVAFRLIKNQAYVHTEDWFQRSYALHFIQKQDLILFL